MMGPCRWGKLFDCRTLEPAPHNTALQTDERRASAVAD
jgi:hypothetical protein